MELVLLVSVSVCEIRGSHGRDYADFWLRDMTPCSLVDIYRYFERCFTSIFKDPEDGSDSSKTPSNACHTTRRRIP
jgi:hypothetical protein